MDETSRSLSMFDVPCPVCQIALEPASPNRYVCPSCGEAYRSALGFLVPEPGVQSAPGS